MKHIITRNLLIAWLIYAICIANKTVNLKIDTKGKVVSIQRNSMYKKACLDETRKMNTRCRCVMCNINEKKKHSI